jgi:GNAT superfamily N-acetyltransferase
VSTEQPTDQPTDQAYRLSEDATELDLDRIHRWLSEDAYWALGRDREVVVRAFAGSVAAGVYRDGEQVAVARLVSDRATFAWLCDVYVDPGHRGHGLGKRLACWAVEWAQRHGVGRVVLATRDAHGVYASAGFEPLAGPERYMEIDRRPQRAAVLAGISVRRP